MNTEHLLMYSVHIKTSEVYHLTPVRTAIIRKPTNKCWRECAEKRALLQPSWECKLITATVEIP